MRQTVRNDIRAGLAHASVSSQALSLLRDELLTEPKSALPLLYELSSDPVKLASLVKSFIASLAQSPTQIHPFHMQTLNDTELRCLLDGTKAGEFLKQSAQRLVTLSSMCKRAAAGHLPRIPNDCVRATHFTSATVASLLISGEDFSYRRQAIISSTSDAFSCNEDVWQLLATGNYKVFRRDWFGSHVVLMDIQNPEHRLHHSPQRAPGMVDNSRILGVLDRRSYTLTFNPHYDPSKPIQVERHPET